LIQAIGTQFAFFIDERDARLGKMAEFRTQRQQLAGRLSVRRERASSSTMPAINQSRSPLRPAQASEQARLAFR
jgi:hypothetical protein